ncbi:MAG: hypothetical protein AAGD07_15940 [Planctomycetota bacterium]
MWQLDVALAALAALLLYLIVSYFSFDDPRVMYNAWTYMIAVPLVTVGLSLCLRAFASRYLEKSVQLGFLFSVFVHLLLLILAFQLVIFPHYFPEAFAGVKPERSPIRKMIPDYLFQKPDDSENESPDWSKPVDAETTSRVVPQEERQLPPVKRSTPRLEMTQPQEPPNIQRERFLMRREEPQPSIPKPADMPSKLARRRTRNDSLAQPISPAPQAPEFPLSAPVRESSPTERSTAEPQPRRSEQGAPITVAAAPQMKPEVPVPRTPAALRRTTTESRPRVGDSGLRRQSAQRVQRSRPAPVGSVPAPPTVSIARTESAAPRMLAPVDTPLNRQSETKGAQISMQPQRAPAMSVASLAGSSLGDLPQRRNNAAAAGMPNASGTQVDRPRGRSRRGSSRTQDQAIVGSTPNAGAIADRMTQMAPPSDAPTDAIASQRLGIDDPRNSKTSDATVTRPVMEALAAAEPVFDLRTPEGVLGLANTPSIEMGIMPSTDPLESASMDLNRSVRPRRDVGGPVTPAGLSVAAVESFSRRVQRTNGGAAPAPAGMVGPATEEAIELGLAYLASSQNPDGSWSLQGHGEDVILQSDTAATGLCLLAFQGAGYTHRQHQYAPTVAKALEFLKQNQRSNGDLYRRENTISDQNVGFYSHGIAALAMCEAYGMTQDLDLSEPAQMSLDYIAATQHRTRGGWRYTPQISSDTSVTGWMMMALKSGELAGLRVDPDTYAAIERWLELAKASPNRRDLYVYNPYAPNTAAQGHGRKPTATMTSVGILMRMYSGWRRDNPDMQAAADYILKYPPRVGTRRSPARDTYYWYYATQVMFHMGGSWWDRWNQALNPVLIDSQITEGPEAGSWDPEYPVPDRWSTHAGRLYVTTMNLLNLEVYYRHLPIYEETAGD